MQILTADKLTFLLFRGVIQVDCTDCEKQTGARFCFKCTECGQVCLKNFVIRILLFKPDSSPITKYILKYLQTCWYICFHASGCGTINTRSRVSRGHLLNMLWFADEGFLNLYSVLNCCTFPAIDVRKWFWSLISKLKDHGEGELKKCGHVQQWPGARFACYVLKMALHNFYGAEIRLKLESSRNITHSSNSHAGDVGVVVWGAALSLRPS